MRFEDACFLSERGNAARPYGLSSEWKEPGPRTRFIVTENGSIFWTVYAQTGLQASAVESTNFAYQKSQTDWEPLEKALVTFAERYPERHTRQFPTPSQNAMLNRRPSATSKISEARVHLWDALKKLQQAKHELGHTSPVVFEWLKETDEEIRNALRKLPAENR